MEKTIAFERARKIALANIDRIPALQNNAKFAVAALKRYLDDGTVLKTRRNWDPKCPSVYNLLRARVSAFVKGCDVRCIDELLELFPRTIDNRIPGWVYNGVVAYMDDDTGEWMLEPRRVA